MKGREVSKIFILRSCSLTDAELIDRSVKLRTFFFAISSFFSVLHFLVVGSVRWIQLTHVGVRAHV